MTTNGLGQYLGTGRRPDRRSGPGEHSPGPDNGRALTAGELAWHAGVSAQTTSGHLAKLAEAQLAPSIGAAVARAAAHAEVHWAQAGLALLDRFDTHSAVSYQPYWPFALTQRRRVR